MRWFTANVLIAVMKNPLVEFWRMSRRRFACKHLGPVQPAFRAPLKVEFRTEMAMHDLVASVSFESSVGSEV